MLAGCSIFGSLFGAEKPKPKELEPIVAPITVRPVWNQRVGAVEFPLTVAVNGNVLTLAASDGSVRRASRPTSGRVRLARRRRRQDLGRRRQRRHASAAVVTRDGELVALEGGQVKWKKVLGVRVATAPLVAGGRIFVLGVDRTVHAFDASDGIKLWQVQRPGDALTLSQTGVIVAFKNTLVVGQGPRMAGFDPVTSALRWEAPLGSPRGANEVERLADLIGPVVRSGDLICARSFQAAVGCVDAQRGNVAWTKTVGGTDAIGGDAELLFGADASDRINAWRTADRRRRLDLGGAHVPRPRRAGWRSASRSSSATSTARALALARQGRIAAARVPTDGSAIVGAAGQRRRPARRRHAATAACSRFRPALTSRVAPRPATPMKPVIALVGRPNVGKSTLFNRLTQDRATRSSPTSPGLTRDRHYGDGRSRRARVHRHRHRRLRARAETGIIKEMAKQTRQAVAEADVVVFVVDARAGLSAQDHDIADYLRKRGKPRRARGQQGRGHAATSPLLAEFYELGLGEPHPDLGGARAGRPRPGRARRSSALAAAPSRGRRATRSRADAADQARRRRPAQRRQVHADQRLLGEERADRLRPAGHHARRDRRAVRARRPAASR